MRLNLFNDNGVPSGGGLILEMANNEPPILIAPTNIMPDPTLTKTLYGCLMAASERPHQPNTLSATRAILIW